MSSQPSLSKSNAQHENPPAGPSMPISRVTSVMAYLKKKFHDVPSVHMAYSAAILARAGHEVIATMRTPDASDLEQVARDATLPLTVIKYAWAVWRDAATIVRLRTDEETLAMDVVPAR